MNKFDWLLFIIAISLMTISFLIGANNSFKKEVIIKYDTIEVITPDYNLIKQIDSLSNKIDSIQALNLRYEEELNIALFKIDRIKEYNKIAGNGNNIKYLRGWINRTLNE